MTKPCKTCPWRVSNHGIEKPDFMIVDDVTDPFSERNAKRLWQGIRRGEVMNCHAKDTGQGGSGDGETVCAGSVGLVIHELNTMADDKAAYKKSRRGFALTMEGVRAWVGMLMIGRISLFGPALPATPIDCDEPLGVAGTAVRTQ